jgi:hypothetical protein
MQCTPRPILSLPIIFLKIDSCYFSQERIPPLETVKEK